uniref:Uncharacterized protein n=1 Tax=Klebsiella pneumoniae TaxID=573 RepID=A0A8B0SV82_KLEPN|nr:hypothetical protein [Klebsiella pneumoniae]
MSQPKKKHRRHKRAHARVIAGKWDFTSARFDELICIGPISHVPLVLRTKEPIFPPSLSKKE